jgi:hypothetical protein
MGFTAASIVAEQRGEIIQISTGCSELNTILEGEQSGYLSFLAQAAPSIHLSSAAETPPNRSRINPTRGR